MLSTFLFLTTIALVVVRFRPGGTQIRVDKPGICFTCGYDLTATPESHPCPECGIATREHYKARPLQAEIYLQPDRKLWCGQMVLLMLAYVPLAIAAAELLFARRYPGADPSKHHSLAAAEFDSLFCFIQPVIALTPLLALIPDHRHRVRSLAAALTAAIALNLLLLRLQGDLV